jgi:Pyruvate/2-oxoacid:ferredoxin oxidoreductase gamma subunit
VPVLELGLVNPIDESVVERVLRYSQELVVLESRPGSIEADVLRIAEALRRREPNVRLACVSSQPITDEPNPVLRADEALHPSILARRIVPLLMTSHPRLEPPFVVDPPKLANPPAPRGRGLGAPGALHSVREVLADIDQWLRERTESNEEPDNAPTALALDGAEPDHAAGVRMLTVETWSDRRFLIDGLAALRQAAWDDRPWMFVVCALGSEEVSDLVRLAQGAIPSRRAHGARIESANLNDRMRLRELFQTLATTTRLSVVVVHDGPPPRYDVAALEHDCAEIDRLGYEPRQLVVLSAQANCAIRRSFDRTQPQRPLDGVAPLRTQLTVLRLSRPRRDGRVRFRLRPMYEAVEVVRERPPAAVSRRSTAPRLELPKPVHALSAQWRAHLAGFRGAGPGVAATALCEAGRRMGYQVRSLHDPTPIGRGRRAWAQVLFTRPQPDKGPLPITARIPFGEADLLLGLDSAEAMRAVDAAGDLRVANLDQTYVVANVGAFGDEDEPVERPAETDAALRVVTRDDVRLLEDLAAVARSVFHTDRVTDLVLLGLAYQLGLTPVSHEAIEGGVQAVEDRGFGRAMEAFQFGRRLAARGVTKPREADAGSPPDVEQLVRRTVRLLRCGRVKGRVDIDQFAELIDVTLERTPGLTETDAGREARRDMVIALHRCTLWGGLEHAGRYAELIIRLYRADRGDAGRALTRNAVLPLAEAMLIRDPIYIASLVMSPGHRRRARRWLNVKTARGDRLTRRFLTRVEIAAMQRRVRLDIRTSDWTAWVAARLRDRIPPGWRGTAHEREVRDLVINIVEQATAAPREEYDHWCEAMQRLHLQAMHDRLFGMAVSELKMLVET